jgi:PAS domain S-box-containing protein
LPVDTGLAFVIIQHLASGQESLLTDILSRFTKMQVHQVEDGMNVEPNRVYVIPPGSTMTLEDGNLKLCPKGKSLRPIDAFLSSLSTERKTQAIGVVLSGTGTDGTEGLKAIKTEGGITFAQDIQSAQYSGMPQSAISADSVDFVLSPEKISKELSRIAKNPQLVRAEMDAQEPQITKESGIRKIFTLLKLSFNVDFTHYKHTVVNRRIARRMVISHVDSIKKYSDYLETHQAELQALFHDMLIGVTSFFREPSTFLILKETLFPELLKNRVSREPIRIWIPGCSTGEEAYSFAISLQEYLEEKSLGDLQVQVFGTDVNEKNVDRARQGIYPKSIEANVSDARLNRFFSSFNGKYQIAKVIRDMCVFAKQDITADPPFSNMDLISCRNMLIYFDSHLQERIVPILHYALKPNGFLVLGESESIGKFTALFEPVNKKSFIYTKKKAQPRVNFGFESASSYVARAAVKESGKKDSISMLRDEMDKLLITEYVPAALLLNNNLDILVFRGNVTPYLSPESGQISFNVAKMIRKELRADVQTAVYQAKKENKPVKKEAIRVKYGGQQKTFNIQVIPLGAFFLVLIEDVSSAAALLSQTIELNTTPEGRESVKDSQLRDLKEELSSSKQSLQTVIETQEVTNEELRSAMEEVQSSNEELQSTNEELETAKEELQSSNEELTTLNDELKNRNQSLGRLNDNLTNLTLNVDSAVVMVDCDLKIRLFTPSAQKILNIGSSDIGLYITNLRLPMVIPDLEKAILDAIKTFSTVNKEVCDKNGRFYELRVRPYIAEEKRVDGAVLSFVDVDVLKKHENEIKAEEEKFRTLAENSPDIIVRFDRNLRFLYVNSAVKEISAISPKNLIGKTIEETDLSKKSAERWNQVLKNVIQMGKVEKGEFEFSGLIDNRIYRYVIIPEFSATSSVGSVLSLLNDITERKKVETEREIIVEFLRIANASTSISSLITGALDFFQKQCSCEAVGIRLKEGEDYPYYETKGFSPEHVQKENKLCASDKEGYLILDSKGKPTLECMCGKIICGRFDPSKKFFTEKGSFWTNSTTQLLANTNAADRQGNTRNRCNSEGYESLALIALHGGDTVLGLLQLNDKRKDMFTLETIQMWERIADRLALALSKSIAEEALRKSELQYRGLSEHLETLVDERTKQLRDSERLAAIGAVAGMVGHDIRNPLQTITSDVYLAQTDLASLPETDEKKNVQDSLEEIGKNVFYINKIVADLQDLVKPPTPIIEETDLEEALQSVLSNLVIPENVTASNCIKKGFPKIKADHSYLQRILINLSNNAIQAMPNGGELTISATCDNVKATIVVQDTGIGIPEQIKSKIFTPLVTTKVTGQGFGLAAAKRFTEAMGGTVTFESEVGKGTKFIIQLPLAK